MDILDNALFTVNMDILDSAYGEYGHFRKRFFMVNIAWRDIIDSTLFTVHMDILDKGFVYSTYGHYR